MNTYENASATHRAMVDELLADTAKNGGPARPGRGTPGGSSCVHAAETAGEDCFDGVILR
jgi:hypothetical protein